MSSAAQVLANQANSLHSTGPVTPEGKERVAANRLTHGLAGEFRLLPWECPDQFEKFAAGIRAETNPQNSEEERLVHSMIQHFWLMQRALSLQDMLLFQDSLSDADQKKLSLYIRYQTTNERSYYKARKELQDLRKQKRSAEIGFESQTRIQEAHNARTRLNHARAEAVEIDTACKKTMEVPLPGNTKIGFEQITRACSDAIATLFYQTQSEAAA